MAHRTYTGQNAAGYGRPLQAVLGVTTQYFGRSAKTADLSLVYTHHTYNDHGRP